MTLKPTFLLFFILFFFSVFAQIPSGYYDAANGLTGTPLRASLHNIIKGHTSLSYSNLENYMNQSDAKPGNIVWDIYSDIPGSTAPYIYHYVSADQCGNYNAEGVCWNKEHSWPQSWFNSSSPMESDMFHIYPTDGWVNGKRSNYPYGTVSTPTYTSQNGSKLGSCSTPGYTGIAFEPINEYKGDLARSYFYMCTRYYTEDNAWLVNEMVNKANLQPWALALLKIWNETDTVSQKEIDRNNVIYGFQHNRNPFIDHPEWVNLIWGGASAIDNISLSNFNVAIYPNPATDVTKIIIPNNHSSNFIVNIYNNIGDNIYTANTSMNEVSVNLNHVSNGTYVVKISDGNGMYITKKLVVIK